MTIEEAEQKLAASNIKLGDVYVIPTYGDGHVLSPYELIDFLIKPKEDSFEIFLCFRYQSNPDIWITLEEYLLHLKQSKG